MRKHRVKLRFQLEPMLVGSWDPLSNVLFFLIKGLVADKNLSENL